MVLPPQRVSQRIVAFLVIRLPLFACLLARIACNLPFICLLSFLYTHEFFRLQNDCKHGFSCSICGIANATVLHL